jgi:hypothetical protein
MYSYALIILFLIGSTTYSGYTFSKEYSLLISKECYRLPLSNLGVSISSLLLILDIIMILCCSSIGCKRQLTIGTIFVHLLTNIWCLTIFLIMGHSCRKYYEKNHILFWWMNLTQFITMGLIIIVLLFKVFTKCWYRQRHSTVDIGIA